MNMIPICRDRARFLLGATWAVATASALWAQVAVLPPPDASPLAKYDRNRNGKLDPGERAAWQADQARVANPRIDSASPGIAADPAPLMLSPFEVVSDTHGYFAATAMSGTRFNTKIEDIASSLTVMTKEQMQDFAMIDINDVFLYTASAEGSGTYTAATIDRNGSVSDDVQLNPTQANRIRGLAPANISLGNIETMGRVPVDPISIDAIEISRGPNANVFGLGNASGTVNQVPATANFSRNRSAVTARADSYDGYRQSLDVNRVVVANKLAVRFAEVFQHEGFVRKPSGVNTERYNGMIKYSPFKTTTISAGYSYYRLNGNRPNFQPPRDYLSYWLASGKPSWDPVAQVIHVNGATLGPFTADTNIPDYFNRSTNWSGISQLYVDRSGIGLWTVPQTTLSTSPLTATNGIASSGTVRLQEVSGSTGSKGTGLNSAQPFFSTTPAVSSKAIYDWSSINTAAVNRVMDRVLTANVQLDQIFLNTPRQLLAAQFGFLREDALRYQRNQLGTLSDIGQQGQLMIDINERGLDGSTNPYFLRPYFGVRQPKTFWQPAKWDTYRGQLAYKLDLSREQGWPKWLGNNIVTGYTEYKYRINRQYTFQDGITSNNAWIPAGSRVNQGAVPGGPGAASGLTREYTRFYVGDAAGNNVDYAPSGYKYGNYTYQFGNSSTGFVRDPSTLGQIATTDNTGGPNNSKTILKTNGAVVQSHLLADSVVTTFGLREDRQFFKNGSTPQLLNADGMTFNYDSLNHWASGDYQFVSGKTTTAGAVVRPFREWSFISRQANKGQGVGSVLAQFLRGVSFTYNRSDSFIPAAPAVDLFLNPLSNPVGDGKDYGVALNLLEGKLVVRVNHYENHQIGFRGGDPATIVQRALRIDLPFTTPTVFSLQPNATTWVTQLHPTWTTQQVQDEVAKEMGIPWSYQGTLNSYLVAGQVASTNNVTAKGTELEINFNPSPSWTLAASATDMRAINSNVSGDIATWLRQRLAIWNSIIDPRTGNPWFSTNYGGSQTAQQFYIANIQGPFALILAKQGQSNPAVRRYNGKLSSSVRLARLTENRFLKKLTVGGAVRWEDRGAIGYYGVQQLPATITALDVHHPVYDKSHAYFDAFVAYGTRLFSDRYGARLQLNVRNLQENGRLQPISAYPDGTPSSYRIVDPRQFILQLTVDL